MENNSQATPQGQTGTNLKPFYGTAPAGAPSPAASAPSSKQPRTVEITPFHFVILLSILAAGILLMVTLAEIFHKNPYGSQIKVDNLSRYYKEMPGDTRDSVYNTLYNIVSANTPEGNKIPKSGAKIRDGSVSGSYNKTTNVYTDKFIVDIEELRQSYSLQVVWSPQANNMNLGGYPVAAACLAAEQLVYEPFDCRDGFSNDGVYNDPVFSVLPVSVSYYSGNYSQYTEYSIKAVVDGDKITIVIDDATGGNYDAAVGKLKESGISPENYSIEYHDESAFRKPGRAPDK